MGVFKFFLDTILNIENALYDIGCARPMEPLERAMLNTLGYWDLHDPLLKKEMDWEIVGDSDHPIQFTINESIKELLALRAGAELAAQAAKMFCDPMSWHGRYRCGPTPVFNPDKNPKLVAMQYILVGCMIRFPCSDISSRIEERINHILHHPFDMVEIKKNFLLFGSMESFPPNNFRMPDKEDCLRLLGVIPQVPENLKLIKRIIGGELNFGPIDCTEYYARFLGRPQHEKRLEMAYDISMASRYYAKLLERLYGNGMMNLELFKNCVLNKPRTVELLSPDYRRPYRDEKISEECLDFLRGLVAEAAWEFARNLSEEKGRVVAWMKDLRGGKYLLEAARQCEIHKPKKLSFKDYEFEGIAIAIIRMAQAKEIEQASEDERREVVEGLKKFDVKILKSLLPVASHGRDLICEALGWERAYPLVKEIVKAAGIRETFEFMGCYEIGNTTDPMVGVIDVIAVRDALDSAGEALARKILRIFRDAEVYARSAVYLIEAAAGWNREDVVKGFNKRKQLAVRAYGLLPLERGIDEVRERYEQLTQFITDGKRFGEMRRGNEKGAALAGIENLAANTGFSDVVMMEWSMNLTCSEDLRSTKKIEKSARSVLERLMVSAECIGSEDIKNAAANPVIGSLLKRMIVRDESGVYGLFSAEPHGIIGLNGDVKPISGSVLIAHPLDMMKAGVLDDWKNEIKAGKIKQPFKQVLREFYLPDDEESKGVLSNRFKGIFLDSNKAAGLFRSRGWILETEDPDFPTKVFAKQRLEVTFEFPDMGKHYFTEVPTVTSGEIVFSRHPRPAESETEVLVPLADVPPLIFSEVMRDAHLIVAGSRVDD